MVKFLKLILIKKNWEESKKNNTIEILKEDIEYYKNNGGAVVDRQQGIVFNLEVEFEKDKKITSTIIMPPEDTNIEFLKKIQDILFYNVYKEFVQLGIIKLETSQWQDKYPSLGIQKPFNPSVDFNK